MAVKSFGVTLRKLAGRSWEAASADLERFLKSLQVGTDFLPTVHSGLDGLGADDHPHYLKEKASGGLASELPTHTHSGPSEGGIVAASSITYTPTGATSQANVQGALDELALPNAQLVLQNRVFGG